MSGHDSRRAAVVLSCLPADEAGKVKDRLPAAAADRLAVEEARLGVVTADERRQAMRQFVEASPFGFLRDIDARLLPDFLRNELPQTMALVLSYLRPPQVAAALAALPKGERAAVERRLATLGPADAKVVADVEQELAVRMSSLLTA